ncbi:RNA 2',3'-cyclic phosphodiesterase [Halorubrum sp. AD140]|uniref:RNA 2',3'-cyclic phosphodiesterase n=1 Tax=Halorubrum sp. AD140 TaxID=3050073 RepID=UPI002ACD19EF|nr:RNA 2',3'-cyclic phosphodiesterase [Halorubrum sp. AD140]MDZ5810675.1 RNA 2',3'-cyclic phosphodiesterase [Halorubrum sp. AD140]
MRAFFAVDLPAYIAAELADVQALFEGVEGLRFVDPAQAHVTLKFLGDVDEPGSPSLDEVIAAGERAVAAAETGPFECSVGGLGVFPSLDYVSVVWAGVDDGAPELTALHEALEGETTALGVDPDEHAFTPHVTLARMRDARGKELVREVVRERHPEIGRFTVDAVRLVSSTLTSEGPEYETVASFSLG